MIERHQPTEEALARSLDGLRSDGRRADVAAAIRSAKFLRLADSIVSGAWGPSQAIAYLGHINEPPLGESSPHPPQDIARLALALAWVHAWAAAEAA